MYQGFASEKIDGQTSLVGNLKAGVEFDAGLNLYPEPEWVEDLDEAVDFEPSVGSALGIKAAVGGEKVRFVFLLDYVSAEFDVDGGSANRSSLDMSGVMLQAGLQF